MARTLRSPLRPPSSTVAEPLLRSRVALYFQVLFWQELFFSLVATGTQLAGILPKGDGVDSAQIYAVRSAAVVFNGLAWALAARVPLPRGRLDALDSIGTVLLAASYMHLGALLPEFGAAFGVLMFAFLMSLRSAAVPSSLARTLTVSGAAAAVPTLVVLALRPGDLTANVAMWLTIQIASFVVLAGVTSSVIYGLRREVRAARRMGQYEITRLIGKGGMGAVYEATHVLLRRPTAVKVLPIDEVGETAAARFEREVKETARLEHPNSVYVYDYGRTPDGQFYYAMEYLDGLDLQQLVEIEGPLPEGRVLSILRQAAPALAEAHGIGLVHRDIKPANVMLTARGGVPDMVKVLDFGLVKQLQSGDADGLKTQANVIVGTPQYLAPEAIRDADGVSPATDVYALGAVAYFLLTGRALFEAATVVEVCAMHLTQAPEPIAEVRGAAIHEALEEIVLRCLEKEPADRFADGAALAEALAAVEPMGGWSPERARAWWADRPERPKPTDPTTVPPAQLTVELGGRREGAGLSSRA